MLGKLRGKAWALATMKDVSDARGQIRPTWCLHLDSVAMRRPWKTAP